MGSPDFPHAREEIRQFAVRLHEAGHRKEDVVLILEHFFDEYIAMDKLPYIDVIVDDDEPLF